MVHEFSCESVHRLLGVGYSLEITTQALAPQYNTRSITVITNVIYPNSKPIRHELSGSALDSATAMSANGMSASRATAAAAKEFET